MSLAFSQIEFVAIRVLGRVPQATVNLAFGQNHPILNFVSCMFRKRRSIAFAVALNWACFCEIPFLSA